MANKTINQITEDTAPTVDDFLASWDVTTGLTKKVSILNVLKKILNGGSDYAWQSWTPSYTNLTVGNGTNGSKYIQIGKTVFFKLQLVFGTTTAITGSVSCSYPVTPASLTAGSTTVVNSAILAWGALTDDNAGSILNGQILYINTSSMLLGAVDASGTYLATALLSASVPFVWAVNDKFIYMGSYEAA